MRRTPMFLATVLAIGLLLQGPSATADAPQQQGWWTVFNPGLPAGANLTAPDVPDKGLLVQGGPSSPNAFAALVFHVAPGATVGQLTLKTTANAVSTPSTLQVCPLTESSIKVEQGGPMADAPKFDCARQTTAQATGATYSFSVASLVQPDGTIAVAILPTNPTDRVVLDEPDSNSLPALAGVGTPATTPATTASNPAAVGVPNVGSPTVHSSTTAPLASGAAASAPQQNAANAATQPSPAGFISRGARQDGVANPAAVAAAVVGSLIGAGLWLSARRAATRAVSLIGAD